MMKSFSTDNYSTVIFDLGEVIIDLNSKAVIEKLQDKGSEKGIDYKELIVSSPFLNLYETGQMSETDFRSAMKTTLGIKMSDHEFDDIWNAMLQDIPAPRLELMQSLGDKFTTMILSNTNGIHERKFDEIVGAKTEGKQMKDMVHHAYYSHDIGHRKPDTEIYRFVLDQHQLKPGRTLFLDDKLENVEAARSVGIHAVKVEYPDQIFEILKYE